MRGSWRRSNSRRLGVHIAFQLSGHSRPGRTAFTLTSQLRAAAARLFAPTPLIYPFLLLLAGPTHTHTYSPLPFFFFVLSKCLYKLQTGDVAELICQRAGISLRSDKQREACCAFLCFCFAFFFFFKLLCNLSFTFLIKTKHLKTIVFLSFSLSKARVGLFINLLPSNIQVSAINKEVDRFVLLAH